MMTWIWLLIGAAGALYAAGKLCAVLIQAAALQRMAAALEDERLFAEMQMLDAETLTRESAPMPTAQEQHKTVDEDKITALMVSKGAQRISERRAEAGF